MNRIIILMLLAGIGAVFAQAETGTVAVTISAGDYEISSSDSGDEITLPDFGRLLIPGKPEVPSRIFAIAIPPGAQVENVVFDAGEPVALPGTYDIAPVPAPRVIGDRDPLRSEHRKDVYERNHKAVYDSDDPYPASVGEFVRPAGYRGYNLVDVRITPIIYHPESGRVLYHPEVEVTVEYSIAQGVSKADAIAHNLAAPEQTAREIILNYSEARQWHPTGKAGQGLHDFVIITLDSLTSAVQPLVDWETTKGRTVEVVTTSWIDSNYTEYDLAAKMRKFLREKYTSDQWGIEDVLLVGHRDDVPMRRCSQDLGYGEPETDYYYAELSLSDEYSWDLDGDHQYGEDSDPIDFYTEVKVGRIPWSDFQTVEHICTKSVAYEQNDDPSFKKNMLLLGAYFWMDTDNAVMMEAKVAQPWMSDWTVTRLYEKNQHCWSEYDCDYPLLHENVVPVWSGGMYAFVNWAGHGQPRSAHIYGTGMPLFIEAEDCPVLNDDYPAIIFACSCSNSDTDEENIGMCMLKQGAVGFYGATKVAFGKHAWDDPTDGSSQSLDYFFTTHVTAGWTQGAAQQWAQREMYTHEYWYYPYFEMFEWGALWGNPNLSMRDGQWTYAPDPEPYCSSALFGEPGAGYPGWVWFSIPLHPMHSSIPDDVLGFDCGGRLWYWDKYLKTAQVYNPPFIEWDLAVGDSYLLWLEAAISNPGYEGTDPGSNLGFLLGKQGWTWVGMPGCNPLGYPQFMDLVKVQYPVGGEVRTAQQDHGWGYSWVNWGWSFWDTYSQAPRALTPYAPFGCNTCYPWLGYRLYVNVGTAANEDDPDQVTLIWP